MAPPPAKKAKLGEALYAQVQAAGTNTTDHHLLDVIFTMVDSTSSNNRKLYAHKAIVAASSGHFKEEIGQQLASFGKVGVIHLSGTPKAGKLFIKAMYFEEIDPSEEMDLVLEVMPLCDAFFDEGLLNSCMDSVVERIAPENCVAICKASMDWERCTRLRDASFAFVIKNIEQILLKSDALTSISSQLWRKIFSQLQGPEVDISELVLFQQLLKWRNADETSRETDFKDLLPLVRFPLMTCSILAQEIHPTGVLTNEELSDIYAYVIGGGKNGKSIPKLCTHSRKTLYAKTGGELLALLKSAKPGDYIYLIPGKYEGPFTIPDKVTIQGAGTSTTITRSKRNGAEPIITISSDVKISDLQILYRGPIKPTDDFVGVVIEGSRNTVKEIFVQNCSVFLKGNHNVIDKIACSSSIINAGEDNLINWE